MSVNFKSEHKIPNNVIKDQRVSKDFLTMEVIVAMVKKIPLEKLKELFNIEFIDTSSSKQSSEYYDKVMAMNVSGEMKRLLLSRYVGLMAHDESMIVGSINL